MWSRIKKAAKWVARRVWNGLKQARRFVFHAFWRLMSLPDLAFNIVAGIFGWQPQKKLRLRIVVLRDETGAPLLGNASVSPEQDAQPAIDRAKRIFEQQCNVKIVPADDKLVRVAPKPAPKAALDVRCGAGAEWDELGDPGTYFAGLTAGLTGLPWQPVTAIVVRSIVGEHGCSLWWAADYVTVSADVMKSGDVHLAHETAHACGLLHTWFFGKAGNLMTVDGGGGEHLDWWQRAVLRSSPHVTYL